MSLSSKSVSSEASFFPCCEWKTSRNSRKAKKREKSWKGEVKNELEIKHEKGQEIIKIKIKVFFLYFGPVFLFALKSSKDKLMMEFCSMSKWKEEQGLTHNVSSTKRKRKKPLFWVNWF